MDTKQTNGKTTDEMDADKNWAASNPESEMGDKQKGKKKKIIIASCCTIAVLVIALVLFLVLGRNRLSAVTMRILRYEGIVTLFDNGKENALMENMLLHNGNALSTQEKSYIDISLDDTKTVGLDEKSLAEFFQAGKKLEISLKEGGIYFYTTEKLKEDETFDIRTSTMIVGIRGTSGYVCVDKKTGVSKIYLTSGTVHVVGKNPVTGGTREIDVNAGESVMTHLFNDKEGQDSILFEIEKSKEEDLPLLLVNRLVQKPDVLERVVEETGYSEEKLIMLANGEMPASEEPVLEEPEPKMPEEKEDAGDAEEVKTEIEEEEEADKPQTTSKPKPASQNKTEETQDTTVATPPASAPQNQGSDNSGGGNAGNNNSGDSKKEPESKKDKTSGSKSDNSGKSDGGGQADNGNTSQGGGQADNGNTSQGGAQADNGSNAETQGNTQAGADQGAGNDAGNTEPVSDPSGRENGAQNEPADDPTGRDKTDESGNDRSDTENMGTNEPIEGEGGN
ncbi:MAG: FecR domain-containing protein [Lachnospiraceae bacterium]|nr:FecR domain-containing protein [Lachnospiraceae bacterium]